jgi:uncharacterized protein
VPILIAALSGRALAAAARRAGAEIVVADFFGDRDTRRLAPWHRLPGSLAAGIDRRRLRAMVREFGHLDGIVYGAGFEHAPALLRDLAALAPLIGNRPETVAATKNPFGFAALLVRLRLPHPAVFETAPPGQAVCKRRGGAGGAHIRRTVAGSIADKGRYFQAVADGQPVSALFVANGRAARIVGFSRQWAAPTRRAPFRYGGCVGPVAPPRRLTARITEACDALTAALGLVGLNSIDMLIEGDDFTILEINPRPGATLDVFDAPLWEWHLQSVRGALPPPSKSSRGRPARAAAVLYAETAITISAAMRWASFIADVPAEGSVIPAGAPICTMLATGPDAAAAEALVRTRSAALRRRLSPSRRLPSRRPDIAQVHHAAS